MAIREEESKKPWLYRIGYLSGIIAGKIWISLSNPDQTIIGIGIILFLGTIACSPILVFSSLDFFSSFPFFYKILAFLLFSGLFLYYYFKLTFKYVSVLSKTLKTFYSWDDGIAVLLFIYGIYSFAMQPPVGDFLEQFRAELIGAGIATLLIGNAGQAAQRTAQKQEEKKRLILQMGSPNNGFAIEAVRQLRQQGWLQDGSLEGTNWYRANLSGADLKGANLSGADLEEANLGGADFGEANLSGADLGKAYLSETTNLSDAFYTEGEKGTIFPEGFNPVDRGMILIRYDEDPFKAIFKYYFMNDKGLG